MPPVQGISMILIVEPSSFSNPGTCTQSKSMLAVCPNFSSRQIRAAVILFYMSAPDILIPLGLYDYYHYAVNF